MKRFLLPALTALATLFVLPSLAAARADCTPGKKGHCSWTCKGSTKQVTCNRDGGPNKCYTVEGGKTYDANCSDFSRINLLGNMTMDGLVNHDNKNKKKITKAAAIRAFKLTRAIDAQLKRISGQVRSINARISALHRRRSALIKKARHLHQKKGKVRKVRR